MAPWRRLVPLLVVLGGLVAYANSFSGAFVFDDQKHIVTNARIRSVQPLAETMSGRRPLVDLSLAINYAIDGLNTRGYHAFNLAVHILAGLTLFGIVRRTLQRDQFRDSVGPVSLWLALITALLWLIHPLQTQSVTYLIQRAESLIGLFYLLTLYCVVRGADSPNAWRWHVVAVIMCAMGMGTKAVTVTAPAVVLLYDRTFVTGSFVVTLRRRWGLYAGLAATWSVLLACGVVRGVLNPAGRGGTVGFSYKGIAPMEYLATQFGVIVSYLRLSFWPEALCMDHDWQVVQSMGDVVPPLILVVPLLVGTIWGLARKSWLGFAGAWFLLILSPTSSFIPIKDPMFEHRMYLPLAAVVLVVVAGGYAGLSLLSAGTRGETSRRRSIATAAVVLLVAVSTYGTIRRNQDYRSVEGMWRDVLAKRPANGRAYLGLGTVLFDRGEMPAAERAFATAVRLRPKYADAYYNLGNTLEKLGRREEAVQWYHKCLRLKPRHAKCHYNLGNTLKKMGRLADAVAAYREAVRANPRHAAAHINMGNTLKMLGRTGEAIEEYHKALRIHPRHANAHYNLGAALRDKGRLDEAVAEFRLAVQYDPNHSAARTALDAAVSQRRP